MESQCQSLETNRIPQNVTMDERATHSALEDIEVPGAIVVGFEEKEGAQSSLRKSPRRVLIIDGHPRHDSFGAALAQACQKAARGRYAESDLLCLRSLEFDPVHRGQALEPSLQSAQGAIQRADIIIFVYPTWWGTVPALLKGFLDRVLLPGFAFAERSDGGWDGLLGGRTALLITTMDTPRWVYRWLLGAPGIRAMRDATLGFCGIHPVKTLAFGPVRTSSLRLRRRWLALAVRESRVLDKRLFSGWKPKLRAWLAVSRLNFYVQPWIAYSLGAALAGAHTGISLHWPAYALGYAGIVLMEFITVITNELADLPGDRINKNSGILTGGSRVLVTKRLSMDELRRGRAIAFAAMAFISIAAFLVIHTPSPLILLAVVGLVLGIGYSANPLRLSARGLGEIDVAITHSFFVVLAGWLSQSASPFVAVPWIVALPLCISVLPSITLAAFPDFEADEATGKRTLAIRLGRRSAAAFAGTCALVASLLPLLLIKLAPSGHWWCAVPAVPHAVWLWCKLRSYARDGCPAGRIDVLLVIALTFMLWFCIVPLLVVLL
jgi:1,4-dihydroxy-2-naphthoate polyprenyltransferase